MMEGESGGGGQTLTQVPVGYMTSACLITTYCRISAESWPRARVCKNTLIHSSNGTKTICEVKESCGATQLRAGWNKPLQQHKSSEDRCPKHHSCVWD